MLSIRKQKIEIIFVLAALPTILFSVLLFGQYWIPVHDTLLNVQWSHFFLSQASQGEIALWSPYTDWGKDPKLFLLMAIQPFLIFVAPFVRFFSHLNIVHVYYWNILFHEIVLLSGTYALCWHFFRHAGARLAVCVGMTGSTIWFAQPYFNLYFYASMPLCMYLLWRGCQQRSRTTLWVFALVFFITSWFGNAIYFAIVQGPLYAIFFAACLWHNRCRLKDWIYPLSIPEVLAASLTVLLVVSFGAYLFIGGVPHVASAARNSLGGTDYDVFLTYGHSSGLQSLKGFFNGLVREKDTAVYAGMIVLPFVLLGLFFNPNRLLLGFVVMLGWLLLFWMGKDSFLTPLLYYFPGFSFYRHVENVTPLIKFVLLFLAGFGADVWIETLKHQNKATLKIITCFLVGCLFLCFCASGLELGYRTLKKIPELDVSKHRALLSAIFGFAYLLLISIPLIHGSRFAKLLPIFLLSVYFADVYSYRSALFHTMMVRVSPKVWALFRTRELQYQPQRLSDYHLDRNFQNFDEYFSFKSSDPGKDLRNCTHTFSKWCAAYALGTWGALYNTFEQFLGFDPCHSPFVSLTISKATAQLVDYPKDTPSVLTSLKTLLGCSRPKLQLIDHVTIVPSEKSIPQILKGDSHNAPILFALQKDFEEYREQSQNIPFRNTFPRSLAQQGPEIQVQSFSSNHVTIGVSPPPATGKSWWLYYADSWHPHWKAYVNGQATPILKANLAFKAISIPTTPTQVEFVFSSPWHKRLFVFFWVLCTGYILSVSFWFVRLFLVPVKSQCGVKTLS